MFNIPNTETSQAALKTCYILRRKKTSYLKRYVQTSRYILEMLKVFLLLSFIAFLSPAGTAPPASYLKRIQNHELDVSTSSVALPPGRI